jgi:hypothetical protein
VRVYRNGKERKEQDSGANPETGKGHGSFSKLRGGNSLRGYRCLLITSNHINFELTANSLGDERL